MSTERRYAQRSHSTHSTHSTCTHAQHSITEFAGDFQNTFRLYICVAYSSFWRVAWLRCADTTFVRRITKESISSNCGGMLAGWLAAATAATVFTSCVLRLMEVHTLKRTTLHTTSTRHDAGKRWHGAVELQTESGTAWMARRINRNENIYYNLSAYFAMAHTLMQKGIWLSVLCSVPLPAAALLLYQPTTCCVRLTIYTHTDSYSHSAHTK